MRSPFAWIRAGWSSQDGESGFMNNVWRGLTSSRAPAARGFFPPELVIHVKALACELPASLGIPLSRMSISYVAAEARRAGLVAKISDSTVWRWLSEDAIRPWQHRCWIFPRDPDFAVKASRILDLYERMFEGHWLKDDEFVLSTDEKTSIQARARRHPTLPPQSPGSRCGSNTNTGGAVLGRTSRRSMFIGQRSSAGVRERPGSFPLIDWSLR